MWPWAWLAAAVAVAVRFLSLFFSRKPFDPVAIVKEEHTEKSFIQKGQHFLVLYNPVSGSGRARIVLETYLLPILKELQVTADVVATSGQKHSRELLTAYVQEPSPAYHGIMVVSGDGMLSEVINGVSDGFQGNAEKMRRFFQTCPLIPIPAGTSNGTVASFGVNDVPSSMRRIVQCQRPRLIRLLKCVLLKNKSNQLSVDNIAKEEENYVDREIWAVQHISWGTTAEHDYWQEVRFRKLPHAVKTALAPVITILQQYFFRFRLSMKPGAPLDLKVKHTPDAKPWERVLPDVLEMDSVPMEANIITIMNVSHASPDIHFTPFSR
jgi:diacylglycerol kinase family enzyme